MVECQRCDDEIPVTEVKIPERPSGNRDERFCEDCWKEVEEEVLREFGDDDVGLHPAAREALRLGVAAMRSDELTIEGPLGFSASVSLRGSSIRGEFRG